MLLSLYVLCCFQHYCILNYTSMDGHLPDLWVLLQKVAHHFTAWEKNAQNYTDWGEKHTTGANKAKTVNYFKIKTGSTSAKFSHTGKTAVRRIEVLFELCKKKKKTVLANGYKSN